MNHNLALSAEGHVFSWGYNGYNCIGRKQNPRDHYNTVPMEILLDFRNERKEVKLYEHNVDTQAIEAEMESLTKDPKAGSNSTSQSIEQVCCTALNTLFVTNAGELYISGSNIYNQFG
jgi:alpha-tubulin suppressor-like RCC1 family protein